MTTFTYGRTTAADRGAITTHAGTWDEIAELFRVPVTRPITTAEFQALDRSARARSKNTGLFFGGRCEDGQRSDASLVARTIVNLDMDDHAEAVWASLSENGTIPGLDGIAYLAHTTRSHSADAPKLRVLIPLQREVKPGEYEPVTRALAQRIDATMQAVAAESYVPAQGMYFPSVNADQDYRYWRVKGRPFDPDAALLDYPADDASAWPRRAREIVTPYRPGRRMAHPEEKKAVCPIITAVHRAYDPWAFIETFLSDHYLPAGERYYYAGSTGAPSVRIYDDAFIQSDHGTDPAVGQHNTFDLGRIHLFRHLDDDFDTASLPPSEWPSHKAMAEFMGKRPEIKKALAEIEAEVHTERAQDAIGLLSDLEDEDEDDEPPAEDWDELIGEPSAPAAPTIEDVLRKVRKTMANAKDLTDLEARLDRIRAIPMTTLKAFHRDMLTPELQAKLHEITGDRIGKPTARKMLAPTVENLRQQAADRPMPEWLVDWVLVTSKNVMFNLKTKERLSKDGFNGRFNKQAGDEFGSSNLGLTKLSAYDAATQIYCVPMPYQEGYHPGKGPLFERDGLLTANLYRPPLVTPTAYKGRQGVEYMLRLLKDLFPDPDHQAMVLDFMQHKVLYPGTKLKFALAIKGCEEEGKSLLSSVVTALVGPGNYAIIGTDQLGEKYTGWSEGKTFVVIEELKVPGRDAQEIQNRIKAKITNEEVGFRSMYSDAHTGANFADFFITTNFEDMMPIEEDNTRYLILFTRFRTNAEVKAWRAKRVAADGFDYVSELYSHVREHPFQFLEFFESRDFSRHYNPSGRAPWTRFKRVMADDAKSDERQLLEDTIEEAADPAISNDILIWPVFRTLLDRLGAGQRLHGRGVAAFLKPMGFVRATETRVVVDGQAVKLKVWTRNLELLTDEGGLTRDALDQAIDAYRDHLTLDDTASLADNVVNFRR